MAGIKVLSMLAATMQVVVATLIKSSAAPFRSSQAAGIVVTPLLRRDQRGLSAAHRRGIFNHFGDASTVSAARTPQVQGTELSTRQMQDLRRNEKWGSRLRGKRHRRTGRLGLGSSRLFGLEASAARDSARGLLRLEDLSGTEYVGVIGVGTKSCDSAKQNETSEPCPAQPVAELRVVYDTGSADLWVASDLCTAGPCVYPDHHVFNHTLSTTFTEKVHPETFETEYISGRLVGRLAADDVRVGPLVVHQQPLGLVTEAYGQALYSMPIDGIVGLGFKDLAVKTRPLLDSLVEEKSMTRPEFAFFLHRDPSMGGAVLWGEGSEHLGLHEGEVRWFPVAEERLWSLSLIGFRLSSSRREMIGLVGPRRRRAGGAFGSLSMFGEHDDDLPTNCQLTVDSGSTYFIAPPRLFDAISQKIRPMACKDIKTLPTMIFTVRTDLGNLSSVEDLVVPPEVYMVRSPRDNSCTPGIMSMEYEESPPIMVIGEVFMRHYFSIFRRGEKPGSSWIGFAPAKPSLEAERKLWLLQQQQ